jgi:hypothetical protein
MKSGSTYRRVMMMPIRVNNAHISMALAEIAMRWGMASGYGLFAHTPGICVYVYENTCECANAHVHMPGATLFTLVA